jgi:hypothetical protein
MLFSFYHFIINETKIILYIKSMIYYGILNLQEEKYGTEQTKELLKQGMRFDFEHMCMIHESILSLQVHLFSIYIHVYYLFQFSLFSPI